jgi:phospholipid/cholesterol/gamma-HCH transport system substrate-binding protein
MTRLLRSLTLVVALALVGGACTLQTLGGPKGDLTLVGRFDDIQHLVVGHSVRMSDVVVGTVMRIDLDGYDAVVEMSIVNDRTVPVGTVASISSTSLLGENYVRLRLPNEVAAPYHEDGDELPTGGADASFEELTIQLLAVLRGIEGRDVGDIVDAGATAIGGRGDELGGLLQRLDELSDGLVGQSEQLVLAMDSFGSLGQVLAGNAEVIGDSLERAAEATGTLAAQGDRVVVLVEELTGLAGTLDANVLAPHREQLDRILQRLEPIAGVLVEDADTLIATLEALRTAAPLIPRMIENHEALTYGIFDTFYAPGRDEPIHPDESVLPQGGDAVQALLDPRPSTPGAAR